MTLKATRVPWTPSPIPTPPLPLTQLVAPNGLSPVAG